jgi:hypothetical protein
VFVRFLDLNSIIVLRDSRGRRILTGERLNHHCFILGSALTDYFFVKIYVSYLQVSTLVEMMRSNAMMYLGSPIDAGGQKEFSIHVG